MPPPRLPLPRPPPLPSPPPRAAAPAPAFIPPLLTAALAAAAAPAASAGGRGRPGRRPDFHHRRLRTSPRRRLRRGQLPTATTLCGCRGRRRGCRLCCPIPPAAVAGGCPGRQPRWRLPTACRGRRRGCVPAAAAAAVTTNAAAARSTCSQPSAATSAAQCQPRSCRWHCRPWLPRFVTGRWLLPLVAVASPTRHDRPTARSRATATLQRGRGRPVRPRRR